MFYRTKDFWPYSWSYFNESGTARPYFRLLKPGRPYLLGLELADADLNVKGYVSRTLLPMRSIYAWQQLLTAVDGCMFEALNQVQVHTLFFPD